MMSLFKILLAIYTLLISGQLFACPGCVGSMDNPDEANIVYILMIFIGLTYIPFYFIYRTIIKHRKSHVIGQEEESIDSKDS